MVQVGVPPGGDAHSYCEVPVSSVSDVWDLKTDWGGICAQVAVVEGEPEFRISAYVAVNVNFFDELISAARRLSSEVEPAELAPVVLVLGVALVEVEVLVLIEGLLLDGELADVVVEAKELGPVELHAVRPNPVTKTNAPKAAARRLRAFLVHPEATSVV